MSQCPDCRNEFVQPFVCTTCGAEKLYDATVREQASQIKRLTTLLNRTHIVLGMLTDDMHDEDIPPQARALIADVRRIVREELARTPPQGQGEKQT